MRVVFMGTPAFAVPTLEALIHRHEVAAVYSRPDAPRGRGRALLASPVKEHAVAAGIAVEQPATLRDPSALAVLRSLAPDVIVVAAYGAILPPEIIDLPRLGCLNVHASLLPRWRGAAPIQRAVLAGDAETGVSIMQMEAGLDTGPWCLQVSTAIDDKTATDLTDELAELGARALIESLDLLIAGRCRWTRQDESFVTYAAKISAVDVALSPDLPVHEALRRVRASGRTAPSRVRIGGRLVVIRSARLVDDVFVPGAVALGQGIILGCADGALRIDTLVPEGRSAMSADAYARGARLSSDTTWGAE